MQAARFTAKVYIVHAADRDPVPGRMAGAIRAELRRYDVRIAIYSSQTLKQQMDEALSQDRAMASAAGGLGFLAVLLTAAGLFGVLQYAVNRRTREFGLRMALGAPPVEIQRMILGESLLSGRGLGFDRKNIIAFFSVGYPLNVQGASQIQLQG